MMKPDGGQIHLQMPDRRVPAWTMPESHAPRPAACSSRSSCRPPDRPPAPCHEGEALLASGSSLRDRWAPTPESEAVCDPSSPVIRSRAKRAPLASGANLAWTAHRPPTGRVTSVIVGREPELVGVSADDGGAAQPHRGGAVITELEHLPGAAAAHGLPTEVIVVRGQRGLRVDAVAGQMHLEGLALVADEGERGGLRSVACPAGTATGPYRSRTGSARPPCSPRAAAESCPRRRPR